MNIDQRLFTRPFGQPCDSGAVDLGISGRLLQIDIRPKTQGNRIDISREGLVPVAILSTEDFNAPAMVAPGSLTFGRTGWELSLRVKGTGNPDCGAIDINFDGQPDLVCSFSVALTDFQCGDSVGHLYGRTINGEPFTGPLEAGALAQIKRTWRPRDQVRLTMEMAVTLKPLPGGGLCIKRGPEVLSADARDNPGIALGTIALAGESIPGLETLPPGQDGRRLYACAMRVDKLPRRVVLTPFADAGNQGAAYRSSFPREP